MKFAILSCLALSLSGNLLFAADPITPTQRIELFNGKDFTGWTFCTNNGADPLKTWSVTNGVIHCTGKPIGYIRTLQSYQNYELDVSWRFTKVAPKADNGGVLVHIQSPDSIWPQCLQVQGKHLHQGDLFLMMGAESREHKGIDRNTPLPLHGKSAENPVGEWDQVNTICSNNVVISYVNGQWLNQTTECTISNGFVGFQSEGGDMEIRRVTLVPLAGAAK